MGKTASQRGSAVHWIQELRMRFRKSVSTAPERKAVSSRTVVFACCRRIFLVSYLICCWAKNLTLRPLKTTSKVDRAFWKQKIGPLLAFQIRMSTVSGCLPSEKFGLPHFFFGALLNPKIHVFDIVTDYSSQRLFTAELWLELRFCATLNFQGGCKYAQKAQKAPTVWKTFRNAFWGFSLNNS